MGDFLKNVGDFLENDGDFSKNVGVFFSEQRRFISKRRTIEQATWSIPLQYFARITSPLESLARKRENTVLKSVAILSPRAGARTRTTAIYAFLLSQPSQISA